MRMSEEQETLRWPTNLDHKAIVHRLLLFHDAAQSSGLADLASRFAKVDGMAAAQIATTVVAAITWLQEKPEYRSLTTQLEMVAMNRKNLK
jgi:hypothetical protein